MDAALFALAAISVGYGLSTRRVGAASAVGAPKSGGKPSRFELQKMGVSTRFTPDPNDAIDAEGRTHHLQVRAGDVAPRVLSVGDVGRAARIAAHLDASPAPITITSSRGFVTHTGCYKGVPVSVIATLMVGLVGAAGGVDVGRAAL